MKNFSFILNIALFIFIIVSLFFNSTNRENKEKYEILVSNSKSGNDLLLINKDTNEEILILQYDNNNKIAGLYLSKYNGFSLRIGLVDNKIHCYLIEDENSNYNNLTIFNTNYADDEQANLVNRTETYSIFSKNYKLLDNGMTELLYWDIGTEEWISEVE